MADDRKTAEDATEAIASYVTDMLALEHHIEDAISGQIADLGDDEPDFVRELRVIHGRCEEHIAALEVIADRREGAGQGIAETVKKAAASVLGMGAAGVDFIRSEKLPKNLRDDYTALSLACIGYVMLHTTAKSLGDEPVARLAMTHLENHSRCVMTLHNIIPPAVMRFLRDEGYAVHQEQLGEITRNVQSVWSSEQGVTQPSDMQSSTYGL
jgi:ferritin-like metal-binding protein YciE